MSDPHPHPPDPLQRLWQHPQQHQQRSQQSQQSQQSQRSQPSLPEAAKPLSLEDAFAAASSAFAGNPVRPNTAVATATPRTAPTQSHTAMRAVPQERHMKNTSATSRLNSSRAAPIQLSFSLNSIDKERLHQQGHAKPRKRNCESCRSRKVKCDGVKPKCGQCISRQRECIYIGVPSDQPATSASASAANGISISNHSDADTQTHIKLLEQRIQNMEALLLQTQQENTQPSQTTAPSISTIKTREAEHVVHPDAVLSNLLTPEEMTVAPISPPELPHQILTPQPHSRNQMSSYNSQQAHSNHTKSVSSINSFKPKNPSNAALATSILTPPVDITPQTAINSYHQNNKISERLPTTIIPSPTKHVTPSTAAGMSWAEVEKEKIGAATPITEYLKSLRSIPGESLDLILHSMSGIEGQLVSSFFRNQIAIGFFTSVHPRTTMVYWRHIPPILRHAICACGAQLSNPPMSLQVVLAYYEKARSMIPTLIDEPSLPGLQALIILAKLSSYLNIQSARWQFLGMAVRMAQFLKLDVDPDFSSDPDINQLSWVEKEARRRVWWSVYSRDMTVSAHWKRPRTFKSKCGRIKPLLKESIWTSYDALSFEQVHLLTVTQTATTPIDDTWQHLISLLDIYDHSIRFAEREMLTLATPPSFFYDTSSFSSEIMSTSVELLKWKVEVPHFQEIYSCSLSDHPITGKFTVGTMHAPWSFVMLYYYYHCTTLHIHRPLLRYAVTFDEALLSTPSTTPLSQRVASITGMNMIDYRVLKSRIDQSVKAVSKASEAILSFTDALVRGNNPLAHIQTGISLMVYEACISASFLGRGWGPLTFVENQNGLLMPPFKVDKINELRGWLESAIEIQRNLLVALNCSDYLLCATKTLLENLNSLDERQAAGIMNGKYSMKNDSGLDMFSVLEDGLGKLLGYDPDLDNNTTSHEAVSGQQQDLEFDAELLNWIENMASYGNEEK